MLRRIFMALAAVALIAPVASAAEMTVDELIAKNIEARGGMQKIKALQNRRVTGKIVLPQGMEIPFLMSEKRPKSSRMEFTFQGMTGMQVYDGKTAWGISPMTGKKDPEAMTPEQTKDTDEQADFDGPLVDYKEKGNTVELVGKEPVEGADAYKLKLTLKSGSVRFVYLDAESFLEVKMETKRMMRGTEVEGESMMADYREEGGMMMPHSIDNGMKGSPQRQKLVFDKIELNVDMPDSLFTMPVVASASDSTKAGMAKGAGADSTKAAAKADAAGDKKAATAEKKADAKKSATAAKKK